MFLLFAHFPAVILTRKTNPIIAAFLAQSDQTTLPIVKAGRLAIYFMPLKLPLLTYALTGIKQIVTRSIFGSGTVIAFEKRVVLFLAIHTFVKPILQDHMLKFMGNFVFISVSILYILGLNEVATYNLMRKLSYLAISLSVHSGSSDSASSEGSSSSKIVGQLITHQASLTKKRKGALPKGDDPEKRLR